MIKVVSVTKTYTTGTDKITPIKNFNLRVNEGETVILQGSSGSGKTTLLNMIAGLIKPTEGSVEVAGRNVSKLPEHFAAEFRRETAGMIFQQFHLIEELTAGENIALPLAPSSLSRQEISDRVNMLTEKLLIKNIIDVPAGKLSGGEMQRTAIARALVNSPSIILADEPTANLDGTLTEELLNIFRSLKSEGKTIIIATHDPVISGSDIADKIIHLNKEV
ncbi:MAG: ABC transporter ATP-binding protein [Denitrovibrio sp.]|nr:MAG: ABC transporter ATP-binding protein [Denitrovibrio sp.]